jgi:DNA-binding response OmpR family regulator
MDDHFVDLAHTRLNVLAGGATMTALQKRMMKQKKILVVEDDLNLGFLLLDFLESEKYKVKLCRDGMSGLVAAQGQHFDLCLLDIMMPKMDGFALAKTLRKKGVTTPFIFLTAKSMKEDVLNGYGIGAEDYVTKPFDEEELLCKIKVVMRRHEKDQLENPPTNFKIGNFEFNYDTHELIYQNDVHRMTEKENEIMRLLCLNKNKILKRDEAVEKIYGRADYFLGRSFDVYISRLRKLLSRDPSIEIQNVYKVGFILSVGKGEVAL